MNPGSLTWRVVVLAGLVLAAFTVLTLSHADTTQLMTVLSVLLGAGGLGLHTAGRLDKQDKSLEQITHQTNGILTDRIERGARRALLAKEMRELVAGVIREELRKAGGTITTKD